MTRSLFRRWAFWEISHAEREQARVRRLRSYLDVEPLDDRILMSVTANLSRGILSIVADDLANQVQLLDTGAGQVEVRESGSPVGTFDASQVQVAVFQHGAGQSTFENQTGILGKQLRLHNSPRLTAEQLGQTGTLDALLVDNTLTMTGPSGAGFQVIGNWTASTVEIGGQYQHTFQAEGILTLATGLGNLAFTTPNGSPFTVMTGLSALSAEFGAVDQVQWRADILNTVAVNTPLRPFMEMFGLRLNTSPVVDLSIRLGSDLGSFQMPLNNALPYITATSTDYSASFGEITAQSGANNPLAVALDPQDVALYARVNEFAAGASMKGYIPFRPTLALADLDENPLFGHLYGSGSITVGDIGVTLAAQAVLNLNASGDGQLLQQMSGNLASQIFTNQVSLSTLAALAPQNLRVGVNGQADVRYQAAGHDFTVALGATAVYTPGRLLFRANAQANVFASTPVNFVQPSGEIDVTGDLGDQGRYDLVVTATAANVAGLTAANLRVALNNDGVSVEAQLAQLPGFGQVSVYGFVGSDGQYALGANADITLAGFQISGGMVALTNQGISYSGRLTVPNLLTLDVGGAVDNQGRFQLEGTGSLTAGGFSIDTYFVLTNTQLDAGAALNVPVVGPVYLIGTVTTQGQFSLAAVAPNVTVGGFITLTDVSLTLTRNSLSLGTTADLPVVGLVTFAGTVTPNGTFTISATAAPFTLLDFVTFNNATVALSFPNAALTVSAETTLLNIGQVNFVGQIRSDGYFFGATARLVVAGFTLGEANLSIGSQRNNCINLGPFTTPPLPVVGPVTLTGSYCVGGQFSFRAEVNPTPPIIIGGVPFNRFVVGLTNQSLTFGAGVGINFSGLTVGQAYFEGTINTNGDYRFLAQVDAIQVLGFSAAQARLTLEKVGAATSLTLAAQANFVVATLSVNGFLLFASGQFDFRGTANIGVAGFVLSNTQFVATNIGGLRIELHSRTSIVNVGSVQFDGTLVRNGASYTIDVSATANLEIANFQLLNARLNLNNTRLFISVTRNIPGLANANFTGTLTSGGQFDLRANATIAPGGFTMANGTLRLTNTSLDITGSFTFPGLVAVNFAGYFRHTGQFLLTGSAQVGLGGYTAVTGNFSLSNNGASVSGRVNVVVAVVDFSGAISSNGTYTLTGSAGVSLGGFSVVTGSFTMTNSTLRVRAAVNVRVATVTFDGVVQRNGTYSIVANAAANFAGFNLATTFTLSNTAGVAISTRAGFAVMGFTANFSGRVATNGTYSFTASTTLNWGPFRANLGLTLSNTGFRATVGATVDMTEQIRFLAWSLRVGFRGSFNVGVNIATNGTFSATGNVSMCGYLGVSVCVGIGFGVNNREAWVNTDNIGFSLWGASFRPFGRLRFTY